MTRIFRLLIIAFAAIASTSSCGSVFDDLDPCPTGVDVRFVYDYNLESANAFPSQVDCLTLHVYDSDGQFVKTLTDNSSALAEEAYRMRVDLPAGTYHLVAYGGISCERASFVHAAEPAPGKNLQSIAMTLRDDHIGRRLHDHFHGALDINISDNGAAYGQATVHMSKTTNHLRVLLQQLDGSAVDGNDFDFTIRDANGILDHRNNPAAGAPTVEYPQWTRGSISTADIDDDHLVLKSRAGDVTLGYGEPSTSRITIAARPVLEIYSHKAGRVIVSLPLATYLALGRGEASPWGNQEFLDRCSNWRLTFFLDQNNHWDDAYIIVNGWTVRVNDITDL